VVYVPNGMRTAKWSTKGLRCGHGSGNLQRVSNGNEVTRQEVRALLRELIANAEPGYRLPSERELSLRWNAARMTVRHATDALVDEGLVARRHGSGTYVLPRPVVRFLGLTSFSQDMRDRGLVPSSRLLAFELETADESVAERLMIDQDESVFRFTRLRFGSGEPMAIETVWIRSALVPGLQPRDLDGSLYELLAERYGLVPGSADVTIEPMLPDAEIRQLLDIPPGQAALSMRMTDADADGEVVMIADCIYRGDRYQLSAHVPARALTSARPAMQATGSAG
jgi:GntR family transcriptional regulator